MRTGRIGTLRRVGAAAGVLFAVVLAALAVQMARGHDPALGTTPTRSAQVARPAPPEPAPQAQLPPEYGDEQGYGAEQGYDSQGYGTQQGYDAQQQYGTQQDGAGQQAAPPLQTTSS